MKTRLLLALFTCVLSSSMYAQSPDSSFGNNGNAIAYSPTYDPNLYIRSGYMQPQGRVLIGTNLTDEGGYYHSSAITAFTANGRVDSSFGNGGSTFLYASYSGAYIAKQSDNKIVTAGIRSFSRDDIARSVVIERFTKDGQKDSSFAADGSNVFPDFYELKHQVNCIAVDSADYIYVCGTFYTSNTQQKYVGVVRFTPNGRLDTSFHVRQFNKAETCASLQVTPDGSIIAGYLFNSSTTATLIKYNHQGKIDMSFGKNGVAQFNTDCSSDNFLVVKQLSDGSILSATGNGKNISFYKVLADGHPDATFGANGTATTGDAIGYRSTHIFAVDDQSRILLPLPGYRLKRLLANGTTDLSFGTNGYVISSINDSLPGGKFEIAFASGSSFFGIGSYTDFEIAQFVISKFKGTAATPAIFTSKAAINITASAAQSKAVIVYPNPVYSQLSVAQLTGKTSLMIVSTAGNILARRETMQATYRFDVSGLTQGLYYLLVNNGSSKQTISFVKK